MAINTTTNTDTAMGTLPPSFPPGGPVDGGHGGGGEQWRQRPNRWSVAGLVLIGIVLTGAIVASIVRIPYYRIAPGSVYNTIDRVEGPPERETDPSGSISFVTVSQTADITLWEWLDAKLDPHAIIRHEDEINGDRTTEEKREEDQRRMRASKNSAVVVALQRLGHELTIIPLGIEVAQVFDCGAADGLLATGDVIIGLGGDDTLDIDQLKAALDGRAPGDDVEIVVDRIDPQNSAGTLGTETIDITLGSADAACLADEVRQPDDRPFIGIAIAPLFEEELPFDVEIETGRVGGPSAGLAFTLAIMDVLSSGELTDGKQIVATGTIARDGSVGAVGGIEQKTVAAERSGADIFLVPMCCDNLVHAITGEPIPSNYEAAVESADDMLVVGVDTLDDALAAIGDIGGDVEPFVTTS